MCGPQRVRAAAVATLVTVLLSGALGAPAWGAKLVGGPRQAAIARAFTARSAHRERLLVAVVGSTASPGWAAALSVGPGGGSVQRTYYHRVGGAQRAGSPPGRARSDLGRDFKVAIAYTGSGSETLSYSQLYTSVCDGAGGYVNQQTDTVGPMSWSVRYVVDLDHLAGAASDGGSSVLVPSVTLAAGSSNLQATEQVRRTSVDVGCNGTPATSTCTTRYGLSGAQATDAVSFVPGSGLEVGLPTRKASTGSCDPDQLTLGPSLWQGGAAAALVKRLGFLGGRLPANPYAPVRVSWPGNSSLVPDGLAVSPCQGVSDGCSDVMRWSGTVRLAPA